MIHLSSHPSFGAASGLAHSVDIKPKNDWPFLQALADFVGNFLTLGIILMVAGIVAAVILWVVGATTHDPQKEAYGKKGLLAVVIASIVLGSASGIVTFFANQNIGV